MSPSRLAPAAPAAPAAPSYDPPPGLRAPASPPPGPASPDPMPGARAVDDGDAPTEVRIVGVAPKVVSPAWELELLISGAVTFALFQAPAYLDAGFAWAMPRATGALEFLTLLGYVFGKALVYVLLVAFVLNLATRAYWVALVGLNSVFPAGVRWERVRSAGPFLLAEYRARLASLPDRIARVDDRASIFFAFGWTVALFILISIGGCAVIGGMAFGVAELAFGGEHAMRIYLGLAAVLATLASGPALVDKAIGARLAPDGGAARWLRRAVRISYAINLSWITGPTSLTLFSNVRKAFAYPAFFVAFFGVLPLGLVEVLAREGALVAGTTPFVPDDASLRGLVAARYESMRGDEAGGGATIQADIVTDPYVRIFVPYERERLEPALARACPGVRPLSGRGIHLRARVLDPALGAAERDADAVLACLARIHAVRIDGREVAPRYRFHTHPRTGESGLVAHLPVTTLAAGEHEITIARPPRPARGDREERRDPPWRIPFWK